MMKLGLSSKISLVAMLLTSSTLSCQEAAVTSLSTDGTPPPVASPAGPANGAPGTGANQVTGDGIPPQVQAGEPNAASGVVATTPSEEAGQPQRPPSAAEPNTASSQNTTHSPNTPAAVVPDWNQFRYAFSTDVYGQVGSASALGKHIYLTSNPNFCVSDPNLGMVDGTLQQNEVFLRIAFGAPVRGPYPGDWTGPGDYGSTPISLLQVVPDTKFPGFCAVGGDGAAYSGNVTVGDANDGGYTLTMKADLPNPSQNTNGLSVHPATVAVNYQLPVTPCNFEWQYYRAFCETGCAPYLFRPSGIWAPRCTLQSAQGAVNKRRKL